MKSFVGIEFWHNLDYTYLLSKFDSVIITTSFFVREAARTLSVFLQQDPYRITLQCIHHAGLLDHFLPSISFTSRACNYCLWQFFTVFTLLLSSHDANNSTLRFKGYKANTVVEFASQKQIFWIFIEAAKSSTVQCGDFENLMLENGILCNN